MPLLCREFILCRYCGVTSAIYLYLPPISQNCLMLQYLLSINWITKVLVKKNFRENVSSIQWRVSSDFAHPLNFCILENSLSNFSTRLSLTAERGEIPSTFRGLWSWIIEVSELKVSMMSHIILKIYVSYIFCLIVYLCLFLI